MSTTIDSLQIEIQTSSNNAATSINDLEKALKKLNKNGDVSSAVTNLTKLRQAIGSFVNTPSSASKIEALANSLKSLKKVGSIDLGPSLDSVRRSMESLKNINVDDVAPQIQRVAEALTPLNNVKGSGFNAMMNGLKKLDEVADGLDTASIDSFVDRIKELDEKLGPVSQKLVAIGNAFKGVNSKTIESSGGFSVFGGKLNTTTHNMQNLINTAKDLWSSLQPIVNLLKHTIKEAIQWEGIAQRFGRGFGENAEEVYSWVQRLNREMGINVQDFMQYSSVYATMLTGFGVASKDASKMALGYMELTYDIWAGYNDIYKNLSDAAEAVRSAIAGEVEPVRKAGFTIVEATLEQTAANHGLKISLEKATEAQKSYLRYLTLVDQAKAQNLVGTYAKEMNTAEGQVRTFTQQLKSLAQTFGSIFLPILVKVMPWLQAFVDLVGDAIMAVANFFGIDIQKANFGSGGFDSMGESAESATNAVGGTTKALKELKNATLGIDELNIISPQTDSGSGSGAGGGSNGFDGLDVDSLWNESIFDGIQSQTEEIKKKIKDMLPTVGLLSTALAGLTVAKLLTDLDGAAKKIKGLSKGLTVGSIAIAVGAIVWDLTGAYLESGSWLDWLAALGTTAIGTGLAYKFGGKGGAGFTLLVSGVAMLGRLVFDLSEGNVDFGDSQTWITMITGGIETAVGGVITWKVFGPKITAWVKGLFASKNLATIGTAIGSALSSGWTAITGALASIPVWGWIAAAVLALIGGGIALGAADFDFSEVGRKVGKAIGDALFAVIKWVDAASDWVAGVGKAIKDGFSAAIDWVVKNFSSKEAFLLMLHDMTVAIALGVNDFIEAGRNLVKGLWKGVTDWWENLKSNIKEFCGGFVDGFLEAFGIHSPATTMIPVGKYLVEGIWSGITGAFNWIVTKVKTWATDLIKKITDSMKPSAISEKLSTMWTNAKNWWNKSKTALATYTPNIGDIKSKLSSAWTTARNWWIKSKAALATYTPSIGSIKDRLVSAWNTAKTWWNKNVKLSIPSLSFKVTYTTSGLGTIKKAIVNALGLQGWPKLSFAANGGIFDMGSLVWAGEAGPEIVANAGGGKTGVMNVQQMSEAVYEGVYSAVVAAMRAGGGNGSGQAVNVYLDGKQITASVEQRQKERGASLMGHQVYSY